MIEKFFKKEDIEEFTSELEQEGVKRLKMFHEKIGGFIDKVQEKGRERSNKLIKRLIDRCRKSLDDFEKWMLKK